MAGLSVAEVELHTFGAHQVLLVERFDRAGDRLRIWARDSEDLPGQLREVWRRMAFNALVGNVDDHPLNHGVLHEGASSSLGWRLSPAFDITPAVATLSGSAEDGPLLSMATGVDGAARPVMEDAARLEALVADARAALPSDSV